MTNASQRPPGMVVDLHIHTSIGSLDSGLTPPRLLEAACE
jgi:predicted metal-dependent phosphoesterase TrpH